MQKAARGDPFFFKWGSLDGTSRVFLRLRLRLLSSILLCSLMGWFFDSAEGAALLSWDVDGETLRAVAGMARHDQDICPRLLSAFAHILDGGGASLAFNQQRIAEFADGSLHGRAYSDLRLEGDGAKVCKQPVRHIPSLRGGPAVLLCVGGVGMLAVNFHIHIRTRLLRGSVIGSLALIDRFCCQE